MTRTVFNILAICGAAGFSGVMLSIGVTLGGYWRSLPAQSFLDWFTANNQFVSRAIPLIVLPTIIGLIGSLWTSWNSPDFKLWVSARCGRHDSYARLFCPREHGIREWRRGDWCCVRKIKPMDSSALCSNCPCHACRDLRCACAFQVEVSEKQSQ